MFASKIVYVVAFEDSEGLAMYLARWPALEPWTYDIFKAAHNTTYDFAKQVVDIYTTDSIVPRVIELEITITDRLPKPPEEK